MSDPTSSPLSGPVPADEQVTLARALETLPAALQAAAQAVTNLQAPAAEALAEALAEAQAVQAIIQTSYRDRLERALKKVYHEAGDLRRSMQSQLQGGLAETQGLLQAAAPENPEETYYVVCLSNGTGAYYQTGTVAPPCSTLVQEGLTLQGAVQLSSQTSCPPRYDVYCFPDNSCGSIFCGEPAPAGATLLASGVSAEQAASLCSPDPTTGLTVCSPPPPPPPPINGPTCPPGQCLWVMVTVQGVPTEWLCLEPNQYYCVGAGIPVGGEPVQVPMLGSEVCLQPPNTDFSIFSGPYATLTEAEAACGQPPPPPPPPPPADTLPTECQPVSICDQPIKVELVLPVPTCPPPAESNDQAATSAPKAAGAVATASTCPPPVVFQGGAYLNFCLSTGARAADSWLAGIGQQPAEEPRSLSLWGMLTQGLDSVLDYVRFLTLSIYRTLIPGLHECPQDALNYAATVGFWPNLLSRWVGLDMEPFQVSSRQLVNFACPQRLPSTAQAHGAFLSGAISHDQWEMWVRAAGDCPAWQDLIWHSQRTRPNVLQLIQLRLRGELTQDELNDAMRQSGVTDANDQVRLMQLARLLPTPSDLITFSVREAFNEEQVQALNLDAEFEELSGFRELMRQQGYATVSWDDPVTGPRTEEAARLFWRSHWRLPAPGQVFEMLHRLRPGRTGNLTFDGVAAEPVTMDLVRSFLKADDLTPAWRDRLAAISFNPLTRIDLLAMIRLGVLTDPEEQVQRFMDYGYKRGDAELIAELARRRARPLSVQRSADLTAGEIEKAWETGAIDDDGALQLLQQLGLDAVSAIATIRRWQVKQRTGILKRVVGNVKRRVMKGLLSFDDASGALAAAGVVQPRIQLYIQEWESDLLAGRRLLAASAIQDLYKRNLLSRPQAEEYLGNLQYGPADTVLLLASVEQDVAIAAQKAAVAATKQAEKQAEEQARLVEMQQKQLEAEQRRLCALTSPARLKRWFKLGLIDAEMMYGRLRECGWTDELARRETTAAALETEEAAAPGG